LLLLLLFCLSNKQADKQITTIKQSASTTISLTTKQTNNISNKQINSNHQSIVQSENINHCNQHNEQQQRNKKKEIECPNQC